jgi:hypothetical protein
MDVLENLPPAVLLVLALLLLVWLVLLLLVPFMIESIRGSTRKTYFELQELNKKLDRLIVLIDEREREVAMRIDGLRATDYDPRARETRVRKEPTISG